MAAGAGERLFFFTRYQNKSLLRLGGIPLLTLITKKLLKAGIPPEDILVICLEKDKKDYQYALRDYLGDIRLSPFTKDMGTGLHYLYSMLDSEKWRYYDGPIMIHYGDVLTDLDYGAMCRDWYSYDFKRMECMIAVTKNIRHDYSEVLIGNLHISDTVTHPPYVLEFHEKPKLGEYAWSGICIVDNKKMIQRIGHFHKEGEMVDFAYDVFPQIIKDEMMRAYVYDGEWFDLGNARSYEKLHKRFQEEDVLKII